MRRGYFEMKAFCKFVTVPATVSARVLARVLARVSATELASETTNLNKILAYINHNRRHSHFVLI